MRHAILFLWFMLFATPAAAAPGWLACKYNDTKGAPQALNMLFDPERNIVALFEYGSMVDGTSAYITFQAIRARFPNFALTYNRNDGALSISPIGVIGGGILYGECRRSPPPPGAPSVYPRL
jgi:hypothetical protein